MSVYPKRPYPEEYDLLVLLNPLFQSAEGFEDIAFKVTQSL